MDKRGILFEIFWEKLIIFIAILTFLMAVWDAQQNAMPTRYLFFFLSLLEQKHYCGFCQNLPKLNILSVIAIDWVKVHKQTKKTFSSFHKGQTTLFEKNDLLNVFLVPDNFGAMWYTTWQLCSENNSNDLGYMKYTNFS